MQKYGRTSIGKQRWKCLACETSNIQKRPDRTLFHRKCLFSEWLAGTQTLTEIATVRGITRQTLERWFAPFWDEQPPALPVSDLANEVLVIDAIYLGDRVNAALIGRTPTQPIHYSFAPRESFLSWMEFGYGLRSHAAPFTVVLDGQRGGLAAVKTLWPKAKIQRCMAHVTRNVKNKLTRNPKIEAGQRLRALTNALFCVWTPEERDVWLVGFHDWEARFLPIATEKTRGLSVSGKSTWWYTHKNLRGGYIHLRNALPNLFIYIDHPNVPRTTNHIEGGINARLKELLHRHRGLSLKQKQTLVAIFLASISTS